MFNNLSFLRNVSPQVKSHKYAQSDRYQDHPTIQFRFLSYLFPLWSVQILLPIILNFLAHTTGFTILRIPTGVDMFSVLCFKIQSFLCSYKYCRRGTFGTLWMKMLLRVVGGKILKHSKLNISILLRMASPIV